MTPVLIPQVLRRTHMHRLLWREREARPGRRRALSSAVLGTLAAVLAAGPQAAPARADTTTDGLVLWYKLDETSGTVATDSSGNGKNGAVLGTAPTWGGTEGLTFNGSSTYVKVPNDIMKGLSSIS